MVDNGVDNGAETVADFSPVLIIGAGKMGGAILSAWLEGSDDAGGVGRDGLDPSKVFVEDPGAPEEVIDCLAKYDIVPKPRHELSEAPELVMVGVKPQMMDDVLKDLAGRIGPGTLVYSIAAGKTLADIARHLPAGTAIVRAMPNTPVMVQAGMTALIANEHVTTEQRAKIFALVSGTGTACWIENEKQMDAVTAVSGSGPAYIYYLAECLAEAGIEQGLPSELAYSLAKATIFGAGSMMNVFDTEPSQLRINVTSKGGTTAAALAVFMADDGLAPLVKRAIDAAAKRSVELSG